MRMDRKEEKRRIDKNGGERRSLIWRGEAKRTKGEKIEINVVNG